MYKCYRLSYSLQQFTVSSTILCPHLLLLCTCSTFPCWHATVVSYCPVVDMLRSYHTTFLMTCYSRIILPSCWHATVCPLVDMLWSYHTALLLICYGRSILPFCWHGMVVSYCPLVDMLQSYHTALLLTCYGRIMLPSCWHAMVVSYCTLVDMLWSYHTALGWTLYYWLNFIWRICWQFRCSKGMVSAATTNRCRFLTSNWCSRLQSFDWST